MCFLIFARLDSRKNHNSFFQVFGGLLLLLRIDRFGWVKPPLERLPYSILKLWKNAGGQLEESGGLKMEVWKMIPSFFEGMILDVC